MELFHKIYSCYYNVVRHILDEAGHSPITRQDMEDICRAYGFQESALSIIPKLTDGTWAFWKNRINIPSSPVWAMPFLRSLLQTSKKHGLNP